MRGLAEVTAYDDRGENYVRFKSSPAEKGRFDSDSLIEVWGEGSLVRFQMICVQSAGDSEPTCGETKIHRHGKVDVKLPKIPPCWR